VPAPIASFVHHASRWNAQLAYVSQSGINLSRVVVEICKYSLLMCVVTLRDFHSVVHRNLDCLVLRKSTALKVSRRICARAAS